MVKLLYWCIVEQTCMHGKLCYIIILAVMYIRPVVCMSWS